MTLGLAAQDQRPPLAISAYHQTRGLTGLPARRDPPQVLGSADRHPRELLDDVAGLYTRALRRTSLVDRAHVGACSTVGILYSRAQTAASGVPRSHALQARQIESDDGLLLIGDHRHAHLACATHHFHRRDSIL